MFSIFFPFFLSFTPSWEYLDIIVQLNPFPYHVKDKFFFTLLTKKNQQNKTNQTDQSSLM